MDKRSLLAIALTFVILIGWQALFVAPKQKQLARKEKDRAPRKAARRLDRRARRTGPRGGDASIRGHGSSRRGAAPAGAGAFSSSRRETSRGGANNGRDRHNEGRALERRAARSRASPSTRFKRKDGSPVELVPAEAEGGLALALLQNGEWKKLSGLGFEAFVDGAPVADSAARRARRGARDGGDPFQTPGALGRVRRKAAHVLSRRIQRRRQDRAQARRGDGAQRARIRSAGRAGSPRAKPISSWSRRSSRRSAWSGPSTTRCRWASSRRRRGARTTARSSGPGRGRNIS